MYTIIIRLATLMSIIFGAILIIQYYQTGDILIDQLIGGVLGIILLVSSFIWKKYMNKRIS